MNQYKQTGMSSLMMLYLLATFGLLLMCFFRIGPMYLDNWYIKSTLKQLGEKHPSDLHQMLKSEIMDEIYKFYIVNGVRGEGAKAVKIERSQEKTIVRIAYEDRAMLGFNLDVVAKFDEVLDSTRPLDCCTPIEPVGAKK